LSLNIIIIIIILRQYIKDTRGAIVLQCCLLVSHVEYAPRALGRLEKDEIDRRTDGRKTVPLRFSLDAASVITSTNTRKY